MLKKIITYSALMIFLTFRAHGLTLLEPHLIKIVQRTKEFRVVARIRIQTFLIACG
jgi:hypothetical protein